MAKDYAFLPNLINEGIYFIQPEKEELTPSKPEPESVSTYKGKNLKNILVLVKEPKHKFISPEDEVFLGKVLQAVEVALDDIALVNIDSMEEAALHDIKALPHSLLICFMERMPEALMESNLKLYQSIAHNDRKVLWCDPLKSIASQKEMKIKLWQQLKLLFNK